MELHELIDANIDVFVEPCELFISTSGDKIFSCNCKPSKDLDEMQDIVQAIIDICCMDIVNDEQCNKYTIEVVYANYDMSGEVIIITKGHDCLKINISDGIKNVNRTINMN